VPAPTHLDYLLVVLHSLTIAAEDEFDRLAVDYLRHFRAVGQLKAIKDQMLLGQHAYRLVLRGKPYLARLRQAETVDGRPAMSLNDVATVLGKFAALAGDPAPPKPRSYD